MSRPVPARDPEDDLVERLRRGEAGAAGEFYERYASRIQKFILHALGDYADADDILHETFLALGDALPYFRGQSSLFTFACAIAHRKIVSHLRARGRRERLERSPPEPDLPADEMADVRRALGRLTAVDREVLHLKYVAGLSVAEIASVTGGGEHAVESRLARARRRLRRLLER
jgi:RNA polymerase sigma-70 factor (ECF subfamily)